jgi:putative resolvase
MASDHDPALDENGQDSGGSCGDRARMPRSEIARLLGKTDERLLVLYARVSGHNQRPDLERQMERLYACAHLSKRNR